MDEQIDEYTYRYHIQAAGGSIEIGKVVIYYQKKFKHQEMLLLLLVREKID